MSNLEKYEGPNGREGGASRSGELGDERASIRWPVVELRQYTLHAGERDTLIALFDREFIEPQEALGARVLAQFRDLDDADRFVWLRGFESMAARPAALGAFYDGPVWKAHREAANATMIDSDDVLLLQPATNVRIALETWQRDAPPDVLRPSRPSVLIAVFSIESAGLVDDLTDVLSAALEGTDGVAAGCYITLNAPNNFPRLPIREGTPMLVWIAQFARSATRDDAAERLRRIAPFKPLQVLRLSTTTRSRH